MNVLRQGIRQLLTACLPAERWLVRGRRAKGVGGVAISLTFDDGPHPEYTPQVLDRLQTYGWKGTFFVVGERAAAHPDLIRRIVREGHELGNHSYTHSEPSQTTAAALIDEVRRTRDEARCQSALAALREYAVAHSVAHKARIVKEDEFETTGVRALLNLGHTHLTDQQQQLHRTTTSRDDAMRRLEQLRIR